ncbi:hypothetical protein [Urechidicola vernalis]|uniref:Nuclear transport factor 2 family protein n=1 Tax=Urechidicola vernalis TaxID=3075600 RepID=A0ABU2Y7A4_9FLAO|nr:hypothetical protein [Urechidicola sp. P050]MDT0554077.1 hypothetical protein [Urechidicola sp. P050]
MKNFLLLFCFLSITTFAQNTESPYQKDVESIDAIITAYYDVISGAKEDSYQFERDEFLHVPDVQITRINEDGNVDKHPLEAEYIPFALTGKVDMYENELGRTVETYGNMAQVWSAFEIRTEKDTPSDFKGVNSIQLIYSENRWWIASWTCQMESAKFPIPKHLLKID